MKKLLKWSFCSVFFNFLIFFFCNAFVSCVLLESNTSTTSTSSNEFVDFSSDSDCEIQNMKTLGTSSNSITLTGLTAGQPILFVNFNKGSSSIASKDIRCKVSGTNLNTSSSGDVVPYSSTSTHSPGSRSAENSSSSENQPSLILRHFVPPVSNSELFSQAKYSSRAASSQDSSDEVTAADFTVDVSEKEIFIDCDSSLSEYEASSATLRAIGYNGGFTEEDAETQNLSDSDAVCLVWVIDDYYDESSSSGEKINSTVAHSIAEKFGKYYSLERSIFGKESDYLVNSSGKIKSTTMATTSPTGTLVNIVVYDIGADYNSGDECGVAGYFYSKDYFESSSSYSSNSVLYYTNEGKYFYIDSPYCNYVSTASSSASNSELYAGTDDVSGTALTTLFHEFQHMINWNTKSYNNLSPSTWYNEMLSMLAEDILDTALELDDSDDAVWNARIPYYNEYYYYSALDEYRSDNSSYTIVSYSTAYALGSYLARNYGGIDFVSALSQNEYVDWDSILNAVQTASSTTKSRLQLYKEVIAASVFRNDFAESNSLPTFKKSASSTDYSYADGTYESLVMPEIDIFSDSYKYVYSSLSSSYYTGPLIMKRGITSSSGLRAHGFNIHFAGYATGSTVTLTFSSTSGSVDENEQILIFYQDEFSNKADS